MKRQGPQQLIINQIDVKSVDEYASKVQQLEGKVHVPKTAVPNQRSRKSLNSSSKPTNGIILRFFSI
jgi:predicted enzyme related to lactoylglutathione lyase